MPKEIKDLQQINIGSVVEYEQHGNLILAVVSEEKGNKWKIINSAGAKIEMQANRLFVTGAMLAVDQGEKQIISQLEDIHNQVQSKFTEIDLHYLWELLVNEKASLTIDELCQLQFNSNDPIDRLTTRRAFINDKIYFKRNENCFEPRSENVVEQLKIKVEKEFQQAEKDRLLLDAIAKRFSEPETELPKNIFIIEDVAAFGAKSPHAKRATEIIDKVNENLNLKLSGKSEDRAFQLLVKIKHFTEDQNLALYRCGRHRPFSDKALEEIEQLKTKLPDILAKDRLDLREIETFTIDGTETKDMDDALSLETTIKGYRLGIHIADVASIITPDSALEDEIYRRATSIYTADSTVTMLPANLSQNLASLKANEDRPTISYLVELNSEAEILDFKICRAIIRVSQNLNYDQVDRLLYDETEESDPQLANVDTLLDLWKIISKLEEARLAKGAIQFNRREMNAKLINGKIVLEEIADDTPGRKLVSELMILANHLTAKFADANKIPIVFRGQEKPEVDLNTVALDIPEGPARQYQRLKNLKRSIIGIQASKHFSLGLSCYTQATSPIRRAVDYLTQQQIVCFLETNKLLYDKDTVERKLLEIEAQQDEATKIQRERNRYWLLKYLQQENIRELNAIVTKIDGPKPLAELDKIFMLNPFHKADNRKQKLKLGEKIKLRIEKLNPLHDQLRLVEL
jgi:exoribonuclease II